MSIDRYELVSRHDPILTEADESSPLSVGNGNFAYTADITGMQTLYEDYRKVVPLCTMAQWGWHTKPVSKDVYAYTRDQVEMTEYPCQGRTVRYAVEKKKGNEEVYDWLRQNPHKFNLARIGLVYDGKPIGKERITGIRQELKLYEGILDSCFRLDGEECHVTTAVAGETDAVGFQIRSALLTKGLAVEIAFPYGSADITASDWEHEDAHRTEIISESPDRMTFLRTLDRDVYEVTVSFCGARIYRTGKHRFVIESTASCPDGRGEGRGAAGSASCGEEAAEMELTAGFVRKSPMSPAAEKKAAERGKTAETMGEAKQAERPAAASDAAAAEASHDAEAVTAAEAKRNDRPAAAEYITANQVFAASRAYFRDFWEKGGVIDLHKSRDSRAMELERRIVLSQYLMGIQSSGSLPPAETGLTCNSWYGKAHLEMYFWHEAYLPLWNHTELLERSLGWYLEHLPQARENAACNGYRGARWPKMVAEDAWNSPSNIATLLIWEQPHIIYMLEMAYRNLAGQETAVSEDPATKAPECASGQTAGRAAKCAAGQPAEHAAECAPAQTAEHAPQAADTKAGKPRKAGGRAREFMEKYYPLVEETAEFMVDFAVYNRERDVYELTAPVIPVQENHKPMVTKNPAFELEYWRCTLLLAVEWADRLGRTCPEKWKTVAEHMAPMAVKDGCYLAHDNCPDTYGEFAHDHPSMLCSYGVIDSGRTDRTIMANSLKRVEEVWDYPSLWGWDFAVMAMTAVRLGDPEYAIRLLLMDSAKNIYVASGNNFQKGRKDLPLYLPGNGSLLLAAALMTAGYPGSGPLPGFPKNGQWEVEYEGINPFPC